MNETIKIDMGRIGNPFGMSPVVSAMRQELLRAPERIAPEKARDLLRGKLSAWLGVYPDMIALGNGSTEIIENICRSYVRGRSAMVVVPTYFGILEELRRVEAEPVLIRAGWETQFALDMRIISEMIRLGGENMDSVIWLCNPNNPTGRTFDRVDLDHLLMASDNLVIVDEAYQEFCPEKEQTSLVNEVERRDNLIITRTFSKAFGLAESPIGYAVAQAKIASEIEALCKEIPTEHSLLACFALDDREHIRRFADWIQSEISKIYRLIESLPLMEVSPLSVTGVMLLRHRSEYLYDLLKAKGIMTRDTNGDFGIVNQRFVRIGMQLPEVNAEFIEILASDQGNG